MAQKSDLKLILLFIYALNFLWNILHIVKIL